MPAIDLEAVKTKGDKEIAGAAGDALFGHARRQNGKERKEQKGELL